MELYLQKSKPTGHNKTKKNHKEKKTAIIHYIYQK